MSWNIEKPGDRINGPVTITGNTTLTGAATVSGDFTVDTSTLKVDATNNRVGVGTASPSVPLDVVGNAKISGDLVVDTNTLVVDSANNRLGIGTASPDTQLHVKGTGSQIISVEREGATIAGRLDIISGNTTNLLRATTAKPLVFEQGTGLASMTLDSSGNLGLGATPSAWRSTFKALDIGSATTISDDGGPRIWGNSYENSAGNSIYKTNGAATMYYLKAGMHLWYTAASGLATQGVAFGDPKMVLDASGNLGLGTTPAIKFHVRSDANAGGLFVRGATPSARVAAAYIQTPVESGYSETPIYGFWYQNCGISSPAEETIGFVTNSARVLTINGSGNLLLKTNGTASAPTIANADNPDTGIYWPNDNDTLALAVGGNAALYIDNFRNVGIGVVAPNYKLEVSGRISYNGAIGEGSDTTLSSSGTTLLHGNSATWINQVFYTSGTERLRIKSGGQLRFVPLASDPAGAEAGDVYYNSATNKLRCYNGSAWNDLF